MLVTFDTVYEYIQACDKLVSDRGLGYDGKRSQGETWDGGLDYKQAAKYAVEGMPELAASATEAISKIDASGFRDISRDVYAPSFAGSRVSVPDYLGGNPMCMRRKVKGERTTHYVNVFVATTCSAAISADTMLKRGATILALLEYLQSVQIQANVSLLAETDGRSDGNLIQVIRLESSPLDLSTAAFAIAHPGFTRSVTYAFAQMKDGFQGGWPKQYWNKDYQTWLRALIGFQDGDVMIPNVYGASDEIIGSPETWLQRHIEQILQA